MRGAGDEGQLQDPVPLVELLGGGRLDRALGKQRIGSAQHRQQAFGHADHAHRVQIPSHGVVDRSQRDPCAFVTDAIGDRVKTRGDGAHDTIAGDGGRDRVQVGQRGDDRQHCRTVRALPEDRRHEAIRRLGGLRPGRRGIDGCQAGADSRDQVQHGGGRLPVTFAQL